MTWAALLVGLVVGSIAGWVARGSSSPGMAAPEGRVIGTRSLRLQVVTIRDAFGRCHRVNADTGMILPEVV